MSWKRPWKSNPPEVIGCREFLTLLPDVAKRGVEYGIGLAGYPFWRLRQRRGEPAKLPSRPDTKWAEVVEDFARKQLTEHWRRHSERTWYFATALAGADRAPALDPGHGPEFKPEEWHELVYIASMLHDSGLVSERRTECFAKAGAVNAFSTAAKAATPETEAELVAKAELVANAIASHISMDPGNELGKYIQLGSLLDITGFRVWSIDRAVVSAACGASSREGFPDECRKQWAAECEAFPNGRAAYARRPGLLVAASHMRLLPR
jgi:hypothetical protein